MYTIVKDFGTPTMVASNLSKGAVAAVDTQVVMAAIVLDMIRASLALFNSQGRRGGGSWKRLKPETIQRKGSEIILVETGALRASLTELGAPFQILSVTNNSIEFGTSHPAAGIHQYGTRDGRIPARPIIKFTPRDDVKWTNMITRHIMAPFL